MRLQRNTLVSGLDPELARTLARACHGGDYYPTSYIVRRAKVDESEPVETWLTMLAADGYLKQRSSNAMYGAVETEWTTTLRGGGLANSSFLKPITRNKAQTLLDGVLARVAEYNADPEKGMWIDQIVVFGSFLDPDATEMGDLDLQVVMTDRYDSRGWSLDYARKSGKTFSSFMDELFWPAKEARQVVKNRSGYISVHTEDISIFTDRSQVVYNRNQST